MLVLIRQAKIVDTRSEFHNKVVDLLIKDGVITSIAPSINEKADHIIEGEGLHVSGGWIDVFADYCEPGYEQKETIATGLNAAGAGGFTHVFVAPNTHPTVSTASVVEFVLQKSKGHAVALHPLGAATQNIEGKVLAEMLDMRTHGAVAFSDGWKPVQNANLMLKALEYIKAFDGTLVQLPVDASLSAGGLMHEGPISTRLGMPGIPAMAESLIVHRDIELLRYTNSKLHITGVSSAESVELIRKAKAHGLQVTCSVTPYHLVLNDEILSSYSSLYKVAPPIRSEADRLALVAGLKDGTIDCIASHHRPQEWDAKTKEFEYASDGMNVQEMTFSIIWDKIGAEIGIERLIDALTVIPADIFGLSNTGIAKDAKADLTIFSTTGTTKLQSGIMVSASRNNPFLNEELKGKVIGIVHQTNLHLN